MVFGATTFATTQRGLLGSSRRSVSLGRRGSKNRSSRRRRNAVLIVVVVTATATAYGLAARWSWSRLSQSRTERASSSWSNERTTTTTTTQKEKTRTESAQQSPRSPSLKSEGAEDASLPRWVVDYLAFHRDARARFPGKALFEDPNAPPVLIRVGLGLSGGLHDRLGNLPLDLLIANETGRVLLFNWQKPHALENYLVPPENGVGVDWRVPHGVGYDAYHPALRHPTLSVENEFSMTEFHDAVDDLVNGTLSKERVVNLKGINNDFRFASRVARSGVPGDVVLDAPPLFGELFRAFFRPAPAVEELLREFENNTGIRLHGDSLSDYVVAHCRVRHPKGWPKGMMPRAEIPQFPADRSNLVFDGMEKESAVATGERALACARALRPGADVLLLTDTSNLTHHVVDAHRRDDDPAQVGRVLLRDDATVPVIHVDRKKGRPMEEHYGTFVDFYLATYARCLTYGVGNFGRFAHKVSERQRGCVSRHRAEYWGATNEEAQASPCALPR